MCLTIGNVIWRALKWRTRKVKPQKGSEPTQGMNIMARSLGAYSTELQSARDLHAVPGLLLVTPVPLQSLYNQAIYSIRSVVRCLGGKTEPNLEEREKRHMHATERGPRFLLVQVMLSSFWQFTSEARLLPVLHRHMVASVYTGQSDLALLCFECPDALEGSLWKSQWHQI